MKKEQPAGWSPSQDFVSKNNTYLLQNMKHNGETTKEEYIEIIVSK
jgi:hypothetical protein